MTTGRRGAAALAAAAAFLIAAAAAQAHAVVSPPVAEKAVLQYFTLSVPTEKSGATTTTIEMTVPSGFTIDSFEPSPGWKRTEKSSGSGQSAVVNQVTWTGGKVPTEEDAVFHFNASADSSKTYSFDVRQTYSDGSVVDWNGPETADTPAPRVKVVDSIGGGSTSTLAVVALVVAAVGVVLAVIALVFGSRRGGRSLT
jgi:uncharacterized protein YcnI